ncbi:hypothetical protein L226DRAFT_575988 [Lentinus tigrinus ALCF2SS1-7]|uniref:Protein kinase domain-containing protein n=1 Tax=Lentinus tigrinus ALCF2SS1-6 TaxID=1328759 RepID=A0A5C2S526_9APHY|nr:hypothetical protein L227DRAFT_612527 [Lentinus tigrinus ALCF2SS1-6]RPD68916.1 hypothetical protein L226DRAFT_575988 [Lentinus tigrinus ALCF2SS1-7]
MTETGLSNRCAELGRMVPYYRVPEPASTVGFPQPAPPELRELLDLDEDARNHRVARLFLHYIDTIGTGESSIVNAAPMLFPPGSGVWPSVVVAKVARGLCSSVRMLDHEAAIYSLFPRDIMEDTPAGPAVVPKFYGYYLPMKVSDVSSSFERHTADCTAIAEGRECIFEAPCPILLMEAFDQSPQGSTLPLEQQERHSSMLRRLHEAGFSHGSTTISDIAIRSHASASSLEEGPDMRLVDFGYSASLELLRRKLGSDKGDAVFPAMCHEDDAILRRRRKADPALERQELELAAGQHADLEGLRSAFPPGPPDNWWQRV